MPMLRRLLPVLVGLSAGLPVVICVFVAVARLLEKLEDAPGAIFLERLALGAGLAWTVALIFLVISLGIDSLNRDKPPHDLEQE